MIVDYTEPKTFTEAGNEAFQLVRAGDLQYPIDKQMNAFQKEMNDEQDLQRWEDQCDARNNEMLYGGHGQ